MVQASQSPGLKQDQTNCLLWHGLSLLALAATRDFHLDSCHLKLSYTMCWQQCRMPNLDALPLANSS